MSENKSEYIVTDLTHDLGDGVLLPELTKALTKTNLIYREDPKLTFHRYVLFVILGLGSGDCGKSLQLIH